MNPHQFTRRSMLTAAGSLFAWGFASKFAAAEGRDPRFLVVVLRGGLDGLAAVPAIGDPAYRDLREQANRKEVEAVLPLDGFFGLNANMPALGRLYGERQAIIAHAVATPYRGRSHFDAQDMLETGYPDQSQVTDSGWLNRALEHIPKGERLKSSALRGLAIAPTIPIVIRGKVPVETWQPQLFGYADDDTLRRLIGLYSELDPKLAAGLSAGVDVDNLFKGDAKDSKATAAKRRDFAAASKAAAQMMSQPDGPRVAAMSLEGWDTHSSQGSSEGWLARQLRQLDDAIDAFRVGFGDLWGETVVLIATEFGRTLRINGSRGTDHGTGTVAFVVGGAVNGGRVIADWPGLAERQMFEKRDLMPTTDLRAIAKGVLVEHLGVPAGPLADYVFPGSRDVAPASKLCRTA